MHTISKDFTFSASHRLDGLSKDHPCSRLHGHNYTVRVELTGSPNPVGFLVDYRDLTPFKDYLDRELDHRHLNDLMGDNPTAENMARQLTHTLWDMLGSHTPEAIARITHVAVSVSETPKTWASYTMNAMDAPNGWVDPMELDEDRYRWGGGTNG